MDSVGLTEMMPHVNDLILCDRDTILMNREMLSLTHNEQPEFVPASLKSRTAVHYTGHITGGVAYMTLLCRIHTLRADIQSVCH